MTHYHKLADGTRTGAAIHDGSQHFHYVNGEKTSLTGSGDEHTHVLGDKLTSKAITEEDGKAMTRERKFLGGHITGTKEIDRAGVRLGIVEGYLATWDIDRGDYWGVKDQFTRGAFLDSIADHLKRRRPVRLKAYHDEVIGGWPIESMREDDRGLFGIAEVNLDTEDGANIMALVRQGVLSDFSIGFSVDEFTLDGDLRTITKATIWEGSIVDEPMNPHANITDFKSVVPYQDLPLADRDVEWDSTAAIGRVKEFTDSTDEPSATYKRAFLWYDRENSNTFGAYKLPIADVINGRLTAVPRAIFAAAAALQGARGGVNIPEGDRPGVIRHIERYYAKMDMESPFTDSAKQFFVVDNVKEMTPRDLEKALQRGAAFSKSAAKYLVSQLKVDNDSAPPDNTVDMAAILAELKSIKLKK